MTIKIITDSTCDLPREIIDELDISVIPLYINIGDRGYLDGIDITRESFYANLPDYQFHPTTATPSIETFIERFKQLAKEGADQILSIHISESLSAVVDVARSAAKRFKQIPVTVLDSRQLSLGTGFQVELAAKMAKAGESMNDILRALEDLVKRTFVTASLDTLEFLRRSGRMNVFLAGIGSLLQLKPILTMKNGEPSSEKVRTSNKAFTRMAEMLIGYSPIERFALVHTNAAEKAELFKKQIDGYLPKKKIFSMDITPVIGVHLGPGAVGFAIVSKGEIA